MQYLNSLGAPEQIALASAAFAGGSLLVAVFALVFSIREAATNRRHREASVTPHLNVVSDLGDKKFRLALENNGLGPARLKDVRLIYGGKHYSLYEWSGIDEYFRDLGVDDVASIADIELPDLGDLIPGGASRKLFHHVLVEPVTAAIGAEEASRALEATFLRVEYESIHGTQQPVLEQRVL